MVLDFGKLQTGLAANKQLDPRKVFTTLNRAARFKRPSDEQADVLDAWFKRRARRNNTIKMNTGSGKTLVGLLALQSSLNEGLAPAVYISPDTYLAEQVIAEAADLGVATTQDEKDPAFVSGRAILVVNVYKLVNGRSVFGVGKQGIKIPISAIVIDDAHACLTTVADQFSLKLKAGHPVYDALLALFRDELQQQSPPGVLDVEAQDPHSIMLVPFWAWKDRQTEVVKLLHAHREDDAVKWPWPLLQEVLPLCQCIFGGGRLEIAPRLLPIDTIPAFTGAARRIYMTATLADDGVLISHFQADPNEVTDPIRPKGGGDIGDRMILAPQEVNPDITVGEIKALAAEIAETRNVAVIVPSAKRAEYWADVADQTLDRNNIGDGVEKMKVGHVGLSVLINKYDGVDLPGKACELLILDGLPEVYGLAERIEMAAIEGTELQLLRQVQRIEQGMGRGVRSSEDHCVVLLLGAKLTQRLHMSSAREKFTPATQAQLNLGRQVTEQVRDKPLAELKPVLDLCLERDAKWVAASRSAVVNAPEGPPSHIDPAVIKLREAFDSARVQQFDVACDRVQDAVNVTTDKRAKGHLLQQLGEYMHHVDQARAQEIQLSAVKANSRLTKPIAGVSYAKLAPLAQSQAARAAKFMEKFLEANDLLIWVNGLLEDFSWGEEGSKRFETAVRDLGAFLGFASQRPEDETGRGPDNLWAVGGLRYLVIECKSGATSAPAISKADCNQLIGSMSWFNTTYDASPIYSPALRMEMGA